VIDEKASDLVDLLIKERKKVSTVKAFLHHRILLEASALAASLYYNNQVFILAIALFDLGYFSAEKVFLRNNV